MNDFQDGIFEGLGVALRIAEKQAKNPKRIEPELTRFLHDLATVVGHERIDRISSDARYNRKLKEY